MQVNAGAGRTSSPPNPPFKDCSQFDKTAEFRYALLTDLDFAPIVFAEEMSEAVPALRLFDSHGCIPFIVSWGRVQVPILANAHTDQDADYSAHVNRNLYANGHMDGNSYPFADRDANCNRGGRCCRHASLYPDGNLYPRTDGHAYRDPDCPNRCSVAAGQVRCGAHRHTQAGSAERNTTNFADGQ